MLVAIFLVPLAWLLYVATFALWFGLVSGVAFLFALPMFSYASVRMLEQGVQIWRSSSPVLRMFTSSRFVEIVSELKGQRQQLVTLVREIVERLMPEMGAEFVADRVVSKEALRRAQRDDELAQRSGKVSLIGVNRRVYKAKHSSALQDTFADFAAEMGDAKKPTVLGTSVEMERLHLVHKAEEREGEKQ